jgi:autotransporter-associated beta strand protein
LDRHYWSPNNTPPYAAPWIAGSAAVFNVPNSKITGATTSFSSITANEDVTVTPSGTIGTNGTVATITVAPGKTFDFGDQAFSTASGTGFIKEGQGVLALNGTTNTYSGGFTLNQGTVIARGVNALGSGQLIINGGTIAANASRNFSGRFTGGIVVGGNFTLGATTGLTASNANLTFSDPVNLGNSTARIITLGGTGVYTINGVISGLGSSLEIVANSAGTLS